LPVLGLPAERARAPLLRNARRGGGRVHGRRRKRREDSRRALSMDVQQLADGLWRWTAPHPSASDWPDWGPPVPPEVGCVYYEAPDAVVLIDPLLPAAEEAQFLAHLDRDVERRGLPVSILLTAAWHGRSSGILRERYRAGDHEPLDLARSLVDLGDLRVAVIPLDGELLRVAVATEDLDRLSGLAARHLGREELGLGPRLRMRHVLLLEPGSAVDEEPGRVDLHRHVRELVLDCLELADRPPERVPFLRVLARDVVRRLRDPDRLRGDTDPAAVERRHRHVETLPLLVQQP